jgi:hypothetical protein
MQMFLNITSSLIKTAIYLQLYYSTYFYFGVRIIFTIDTKILVITMQNYFISDDLVLQLYFCEN